ncbi:MAG: M20/M25/M40 family metallo-hydrolase, partial [Lachnospiraceae bacterium]|nr:M20/M25/M40 family metallo-hydrolase [Lachnospiraceae bacterium]
MDLNMLEPKAVFSHFVKLCEIPHGSYNIDAISDYLYDFAKGLNLWVKQDDYKNVLIRKPATPGYEDVPAVLLQGHMDMVAVKEEGCPLDLEKDGLDLAYEDGYLYAQGTSLGGDDGIALAYAMAILAADDIPHPALEVLFTVNEEVGMDGAIGVDLSDFSA